MQTETLDPLCGIGSETILLADDDDGVRLIATHALERCGYTVFAVSDGHEATRFAAHYDGNIDLFIADVIMPELNGVQTAEMVFESQPEVKVLFISANTCGIALPDQANFLPKPFALSDLTWAVRKILDYSNQDQNSLR